MKIDGQITISAPQGWGDDYIEIRIHDEKAVIRFCEIHVKYADFAKLLTGLPFVKCDIEVEGLEKVGKVMEWQTFEFRMPDNSTNKEAAKKEINRIMFPGWTCSDNFSSQYSFFRVDAEQWWARATIRRWVDGNDIP